jgi:hypothetical protein
MEVDVQMKILISVNHPAHVHLFKNAIWTLQDHNHDILVCARRILLPLFSRIFRITDRVEVISVPGGGYG